MKKVLKTAAKILGIPVAIVLVAAVGLVTWLTVTEYKPEAVETVQVSGQASEALNQREFTVLSWNLGYCALGVESDFFMDGGKEVRPDSVNLVTKNRIGAEQLIAQTGADFTLLQEVDSDSRRSYGVDEVSLFRASWPNWDSAYALNYSCDFVPYPLPPIGKVHAGLLSFSSFDVREARRISLPCPFSWPMRAVNLKRCLLVERIPIEGSERELVLVNLHLEAYDDGEGKKAQTEQLLRLLNEEYAKGNYVVAGGDWNQAFPGTLDAYPIHVKTWVPGVLDPADVGDWSFAFDASVPTCRLLNQPYDPADTENTQYYVIDGFLVSPNLEVSVVETVDQGFAFSDHNPVLLTVSLGE
ncbi:MAG: endonuclease [Oscillospiraceae bacterium]|nr:endonuclease [Oscillospiraceae bacterium]